MSADYWTSALQAKAAGTKMPDMHEGDPQPGYYRARRKTRDGQITFHPVHYFQDWGGVVQCVASGASITPESGQELWTSCGQHPVTQDAYNRALAGEPWPDIDSLVHEQDRLAIGGNNPPEDLPTQIREQIETAKEGIKAYAKITSDEQAQRAQTLRSRLTELRGKADKAREAEKRPHLEAGKEVDVRWKPAIESATDAANKLRAAMEAWEDEKRAKAVQSETPIVEAPKPIRGSSGRAASVGTKKVAVIVDQDAAYAFLRTQPDVIAVIATAAQRLVDAGHDVPGTKIEQKAKIR